MIVEHFPVGFLGCNCVILGDEESGEAIVVDPGGDPETILARLEKLGLRCTAIVHTHTHFDHVGSTHDVQHATGAPTMLHEADLELYQGMQAQLDAFGMPMRAPEAVDIDRFLVEGDTVRAGAIEADVLHTPGHTQGSLCFRVDDDRPIVLAGDTLFQGSIGRTDLWGGSMPELLSSVKTKLLSLPDETLVIAGHGPTTTIGEERATNPFLQG
ncbi:MAG: MBL fold metallo-hydrolase [Deltaproteobacteria bacterium]|nr:MBL fold metallo-hydrolase [Deltaproteobacteria bacterium]